MARGDLRLPSSEKEFILREIRRLAEERGGPPGARLFAAETGIPERAWAGKHWTTWGEAVREAGFEPNSVTAAYPKDVLLEALAKLTRELSAFPVVRAMRLKRRRDASFPSDVVFFRSLGPRPRQVASLLEWCRVRDDWKDVVSILETSADAPAEERTDAAHSRLELGYVYLIRHGNRREFKIGRTNNPLRREGEVGIELPEEAKPIHVIATDDPSGIEAYWHNRFAAKRKNGEWFALSAEDVNAFKRWKRIY